MSVARNYYQSESGVDDLLYVETGSVQSCAESLLQLADAENAEEVCETAVSTTKYGSFDEGRPLLEPSKSVPANLHSELSEDRDKFNHLTVRHIRRRHVKPRHRRFSHQTSVMMAPPFVLPTTADINESSEDSSSSEDESVVSGEGKKEKHKLAALTTRQKVTICMLALANFCSTTVFSCIAPFFPTVAAQKGASKTIIGLIFGTFELFIFLVSPIIGRTITTVGSKFMYTAGMFTTGITALLFGFLNFAESGTTFIVLCFVVRLFEAAGDAAFLTASFTITAHEFPGRVSTIIGILETFSGLGYTAGPFVGGLLYEAGGFQLPFTVLGVVLLLASFISIFLIPSRSDASSKSGQGSYLGLLKIPEVDMCLFVVIVSAISLAYLDPTVEPHLKQIDPTMTALFVGLFFLLDAGVYAITAPMWGRLVDKYQGYGRYYMMFGSALSVICFLLIGPSKIFPFQSTLWLVGLSLVINGFGIGAQLIPPFSECLNAALRNGYADSPETHGLISGLFQASMSLGGFLGPTLLGGALVELISFEWTSTIVAFIHLLALVLTTVFVCLKRKNSAVAPLQSHLSASTLRTDKL